MVSINECTQMISCEWAHLPILFRWNALMFEIFCHQRLHLYIEVTFGALAKVYTKESGLFLV